MEPSIIFALYANHMHSELPRPTFQRMMKGELEQMIKKINIPVTYSTHGEDIDLYKKLSPAVVDAINYNPKLKFLKSTYNAVLPTMSFKQLNMQMNEADKTAESSFQGKLEPLRFFSEHDFNQEIWDITGKAEPSIILEDAHNYYEHRGDLPLPAARLYTSGKHVIGLPYKSKNIPVLINKGIRPSYLGHFRGTMDSKEVLKSFENELQLAKQNGEPCVLFLTDLEVPQINEVNGQSRLDKWEELMITLKDSDLAKYFTHYNKVEDDVVNYVENLPNFTLDRRQLTKWNHSTRSQKKVLDSIAEAGKKGLMENKYFQFVGMHAQFKDILSWAMLKSLNGKPLSEQDVDYTILNSDQLQDKIIELPTDRGTNVRITSDSSRLDEFKHFTKALESGNELIIGSEKLSPSLQHVIKALHEIYSEK